MLVVKRILTNSGVHSGWRICSNAFPAIAQWSTQQINSRIERAITWLKDADQDQAVMPIS
jgi:hypothetical protein